MTMRLEELPAGWYPGRHPVWEGMNEVKEWLEYTKH